MTIIVNGEPKTDVCPFLLFEEIVSLSDVLTADTVTYRQTSRPFGDALRQGVLQRGESVCVMDGMIFNVANTGAA